MSTHYYVACDLGAESGRVILGTLKDRHLSIEEVHRFPNGAVTVCHSLRWDLLRIFDELKAGLRQVAGRGLPVTSLSTDSWGVDYVLLRDREPMLTVPYHYRDPRTDGALDRAFPRVSARDIFEETGLQFMTINTLYQLLADQDRRPHILAAADRFLGIGDYFNYLFSGVARGEESLASTTQLWNPRRRAWSQTLIQKFGLPEKIFPEVVPSGTRLGPLLSALAKEAGLEQVEVVATCSHDTGAAVAAVPAEGDSWAYLSSGTWSLLGMESSEPVITAKCREYDFTNEVGCGSTVRLLKNIVGLWIVQECRRTWAKAGQEYTYPQLGELAAQAAPLKCLIDPNAPPFGKPDEMPQKIADYCRSTGQTPPANAGETVRCAYESLALLYRRRLEEVAEITGREVAKLHVVGGGSQSELLSQLTANATQIPVHCGPVEATAIGNILIQAMAMGQVASLVELRKVVRHSFPIKIYQPQDRATWQAAYRRFQKLTAKS